MKYDNFGKRVVDPETDDPRYTMRLFLIREQRPKYWNFYCMYCGQKVCEVNGTVLYVSDISGQGLQTSAVATTRVRCNSRQCAGRAWFEFEF